MKLDLLIKSLSCENSRHFAKLPLVFPWNEVWETNAEIPYWWRVTTQVWIVLVIGWRFALLTNQKNYPDLGSVAPSVWNFCTCFSDINFTGKAAVVWRNVGWFLRSLNLPLFSPALRHVPSVPFQLLNLRFTIYVNRQLRANLFRVCGQH